MCYIGILLDCVEHFGLQLHSARHIDICTTPLNPDRYSNEFLLQNYMLHHVLIYENFFMDLSKVKMNCKYIALFKVHSISLSRLAVPMLLWGLLLSMLKDILFILV